MTAERDIDPVFDEQPVQSIGAIALDPKNSKNVWVGTGESWTRNSVSIGDGIYKSTDGGETWTHAGLEKSERIAQIAVDPRNSDTVFAAVPGALWSDSPDRGLYKTTDGGKTWNQVLKGANLSTGCTDVADRSEQSRDHVRGDVGFPAQRLGIPLGRRKSRPRLQPADCSVRPTAATPGRRLQQRPTKVSRRNRMDAWRWRSRLRKPNAFTLLSSRRRARCSFPMTAARPGRNVIKANGWCGGRSISRT